MTYCQLLFEPRYLRASVHRSTCFPPKSLPLSNPMSTPIRIHKFKKNIFISGSSYALLTISFSDTFKRPIKLSSPEIIHSENHIRKSGIYTVVYIPCLSYFTLRKVFPLVMKRNNTAMLLTETHYPEKQPDDSSGIIPTIRSLTEENPVSHFLSWLYQATIHIEFI